jgi:hypothetical protein
LVIAMSKMPKSSASASPARMAAQASPPDRNPPGGWSWASKSRPNRSASGSSTCGSSRTHRPASQRSVIQWSTHFPGWKYDENPAMTRLFTLPA